MTSEPYSSVNGTSIGNNIISKNPSVLQELVPRFHIPGETNNLIAFNVCDDSLLPDIRYGDIVMCQELNSLSDIKDDKIYVVAVLESIWIKKVKTIKDNETRDIVQLKLFAGNSKKTDVFFVPISDVKGIYRVKHKLSGF